MSIVYIIIIVTCLISIAAFNSPDLMNKWIMYPYAIKNNNQWYRFLSSGFLHANWAHLFFNMLVFYFFGQALIQYFYVLFPETAAPYYFILLYLGGIIFSDIPSYIKYHNSPSYRSLGASGAVSSVIFSSVLIAPFSKILVYGILPLPAVVWGVLYLLYSWYMTKRGGDNINHDAHFYGAIFGLVFTFLLKPALLPNFIKQIQLAFS